LVDRQMVRTRLQERAQSGWTKTLFTFTNCVFL
jgi:hypothetical protein